VGRNNLRFKNTKGCIDTRGSSYCSGRSVEGIWVCITIFIEDVSRLIMVCTIFVGKYYLGDADFMLKG